MELTKTDFFDKLSISCNLSDIRMTKRYYRGLLILIRNELKENGEIKLPELGTLSLKEYKGRTIMQVNTRKLINIPPKKVVTFKSFYRLKEYFKK